jgi:hypothetical protein
LALLGKDRPEVAALLDQWEASTVPNLAKAVGQARKAPT